jgi:heptosyltransferase-3
MVDLIIGTAIILIVRCFRRRNRNELPEKPKRILVIKLAALGDTLLLIPSLRALRKTFSDACITYVGTIINEQLTRLFPQYIDEFMQFEVYQSLKHPLYLIRFIKALRRSAPDIVFDFEQWSFITPILAAMSGARFTTGFKIPRRFRHLLYSHAYERLPNVHELQNFMQLLLIYGLQKHPADLELPVNGSDVNIIRKTLSDNGWEPNRRIIVIHPGCGEHGFPREWPLESYHRLCAGLQKNKTLFFIFTGYGTEKRLTNALTSSFPDNSVQLTELHLPAMIALLSIADLVISGNNGIMHFAAALQKPQVALHGPTNSVKWGPLNPNAVVIRSSCPGCPCLDLGFEYHRTDGFCMAQITVEEVLKVSQVVLNKTPR